MTASVEPSPRALPRWLLPAVLGAVVAPLLAAAIAQRNAHWHPVFDLAMTELRVRDVGGRHTPLIGLQGRIGPTGSHPGPLSFYLLAPVYRLLGSSPFALQAATAVFHGAAAATALLVIRRRRDSWALIGVGLLLLLLIQGYGLGALTEPWNPQLPVLWFVAFLVAVWAVVDGDLPMLLPAAFAASICAQTHVPYLAVTLGVGTGIALVAGRHARGRRADGQRGEWRWLVGAAALGLVLWMPPLIDEVVNEPGNLTQLVDHLGTPTEDPIGIRRAGHLVLERMDAWQLVVVETAHPGTLVQVLKGPGPTRARGLWTVAVWLACVGVAAALRHRRLLVLHAVVGGAGAVAVVTISRIYGVPWPYLMLWVWGVGALMAMSIGATVIVVVLGQWPRLRGPRPALRVGCAGLVVVAGLSVRLLGVAPDATTETPDQTQQLGRLLPGTVTGLARGAGAAGGHEGRYIVSWDDATNGGSEGIGLVNELVRRGYDVGVEAQDGVKIGVHRVRSPQEATARIVLASGGWVDRWAAVPRVTRVAFDDPRSVAERAEFAEVRQAAIDALLAAGRDELVDLVDTDLFDLALNRGVGGDVSLLLGRMLDLGVPVAVFVVPPEIGP
jgi:hypothetical protein